MVIVMVTKFFSSSLMVKNECAAVLESNGTYSTQGPNYRNTERARFGGIRE
jgi:hypothetical protein